MIGAPARPRPVLATLAVAVALWLVAFLAVPGLIPLAAGQAAVETPTSESAETTAPTTASAEPTPTSTAPGTTTSTAPSADGEPELPAGLDERNYFITEWGAVNGRTAYVFTPRVVEEGSPIVVAGTGFMNLAGTGGARLGVKFSNNTIKRQVPLPIDQTGQLNGTQRTYVWAVVQAGEDGSFVADLEFPTEDNAEGLDGDPMTPGTLHTLNFNSGALSGKDKENKLIDPSGATTSPPFQVIAAGTLAEELDRYAFEPSGVPDAYSDGDPRELSRITGASARDAGNSVEVTVPTASEGTWLHVTPVDSQGNMTATGLSGQWVQVDAGGAATFSASDVASGEYSLVVHAADYTGQFHNLGRIQWSHTASTPATSRERPLGWFVGPQLTPWWSTSARAPSAPRQGQSSTGKSTITSTRTRPNSGGGQSGGGVTLPGGASRGRSGSLPTAVPVAAPARQSTSGSRSQRSTSSGSRQGSSGAGVPLVAAPAADPAGAGGSADGDGDVGLAAAHSPLLTTGMLNQLLMFAAAALILLTGMVASGLVVIGRALPGYHTDDDEDDLTSESESDDSAAVCATT